MKRFALMISLLVSILCMAQAKDRIVERPPFLAQSSSSIEVDKIVMSDTVTTVYIKAFLSAQILDKDRNRQCTERQ